MNQSPPYPFQDAQLGGLPSTSTDVPVSSIMVVLFLTTAVTNMTIHVRNLRRGHIFILSGVMAAYSMTRVVANIMRIVWARNPHNMRVALAAVIFTNAGVLLLFLVNLIFSQRLLRAHHPRIGWSTPARVVFRCLFFALAACLVMVITAIVYSSYTLERHTLSQLRHLQLTAYTLLSILSFMPILITTLTLLLPRNGEVDHFGRGPMKTKFQLVICSTVLLALGSSFRTGAAYLRRPVDDPAWYHGKATFYCFIFVVELVVIYTYTFIRVDRLFFVPNGCSSRKHYSHNIFDEKASGSPNPGHSDTDTCSENKEPMPKDEEARAYEPKAEGDLGDRSTP